VEELRKKAPEAEQPDFSTALFRVDEFKREAETLDATISAARARGTGPADAANLLNRRLMEVELNWLNPDGIPGRPWFKHVIYAARYTYAHLELPGVTEAVEKNDWSTARDQLRILENAIAKNTELLHRANSELSAAAGAAKQ